MKRLSNLILVINNYSTKQQSYVLHKAIKSFNLIEPKFINIQDSWCKINAKVSKKRQPIDTFKTYKFKTREKKQVKFLSFLILYLSVVLACDKLPDESIVQDLPSYYSEYLDSRANEIISAKEQIPECEAFFWITDIHWEPDLNARRSPAMIRYLSSKIGVDKILNGGDTGNSSVICSNAISRLRNAIGSNKVYSVNGNHEINDASRYEKPFERVHKALRTHCNDIVYGDKNKSYYYFDNTKSKVRYIGLSTFGLFVNNKYESAYTEEQLQWFKKQALNNIDTEWTIIIFTHALYAVNSPSNEIYSLSQPFIDAIDQYQGRGKIACVLMGHSHIDRIHIGKSGVPYILSQCDRTKSYRNDINVDRIPGTISENHFEVVLLDKKKQEIRLFSIGANARNGIDDNPGEMVDVRIFNY